jgi:hypothetical protein
MQTAVLDSINDPSLRAFVAWVPMLPEDTETAAHESAALVHDRRALHFWDAGRVLPGVFAAVLGLPEGWPAWDVYLAYPPGALWDDCPPAPAFWHHQLGDEPNAPVLDGEAFREQVLALLAAAGV